MLCCPTNPGHLIIHSFIFYYFILWKVAGRPTLSEGRVHLTFRDKQSHTTHTTHTHTPTQHNEPNMHVPFCCRVTVLTIYTAPSCHQRQHSILHSLIDPLRLISTLESVLHSRASSLTQIYLESKFFTAECHYEVSHTAVSDHQLSHLTYSTFPFCRPS